MKHKTNSVETYRKETIWHNIRKFWPYYIMVIPGVIYFIIFKYIPLVGSVIAFQDYSIIKGIGASNWVGLENFKKLFSYSDFPRILSNTIILMVMIKESCKDKTFRIIVTVILCIFAGISIVPLLTVVAMSFSSKAASDMNIVNLWPVDFTLSSWYYILSRVDIWKSFALTLVATLATTFLALLITSLMAYPLAKKEFKIRRIVMIFVTVTMVFKAPVVPYFLVMKGIGMINNPMVLVLPHILTAYNMIIMRTFFSNFPTEVEESARIDGCGCFRVLWKIVLPSSKAVLASVGLFYAVTAWNQFQHPLMFIQDTKLYPLQLKIRQLINGGSELMSVTAAQDVNYTESTLSAATVVFAIIPIIMVYPWLQKYFAKGAMLGSVKG